MSCFVHKITIHNVLGNVKQKHFKDTFLFFQIWAAFLCADGQGSGYPLARYVILHGKNFRMLQRSIKLHALSKLDFLLIFGFTLIISHSQVLLGNKIHIAEVRFFTILHVKGGEFLLALVSLFSKPDPMLLHLSANMLWSCEYHSNSALEFIDIKCIQAMVVMVPHAPAIEGQETWD